MENLFAKRLKEARLSKHYTQQKLADIINDDYFELDKKISRNSITRYENGTRTADYDTLCAIAYALDVDVDYLLGKSDKKRISFVNEELAHFINYINSIAEKDNPSINKNLWKIIPQYESLIKKGIDNKLFSTICEIISIVSRTVNIAINSDRPYLISDLNKLLDNNFKNLLQLDLYEIEKKSTESLIELILKYDKEISTNKHISISDIASNLSDKDIENLKEYYINSDKNNTPTIIKEILSINTEEK